MLLLVVAFAHGADEIEAVEKKWRLMPPDCSPAYLEAHRPLPIVAAAIGGSVGFGTGHLYLRQRAATVTFLVIDGLATGMFLGAALSVPSVRSTEDAELVQAAIVGSGAVITVSRLVQVATGADSAAAQYARMKRECREATPSSDPADPATGIK